MWWCGILREILTSREQKTVKVVIKELEDKRQNSTAMNCAITSIRSVIPNLTDA